MNLSHFRSPSSISVIGLILLFNAVLSIDVCAALDRFEFSKPQMGVPFRIVVYARSPLKAELAAQAAFRRVESLNEILSDYEYDSELSKLSRTAGEGRDVELSDDLWKVLWQAKSISEITDGAFDVTVGPLTALWRKARRDKALPEPTRLEQARRAVGFRNVTLDSKRKTARLLLPGMRLDLGSIAKGYAVDEAMHTLKQFGIRSALVAAAGDIRVSKSPPRKKGWEILVGKFDNPDSMPGNVINIEHRAVCTSGDFFQKLEIDGKRYSHIVDPRTGLGLTDHSMVTVIAKNATTANSWATALSVLGPSKGLPRAEAYCDLAVHILRQPSDTVDEHYSTLYRRRYLQRKPINLKTDISR